jgi:hypothetical protein
MENAIYTGKNTYLYQFCYINRYLCVACTRYLVRIYMYIPILLYK